MMYRPKVTRLFVFLLNLNLGEVVHLLFLTWVGREA